MSDTIQEIQISTFEGGMSTDPRIQVSNQVVISSMFDIYSNKTRLTPFRTFEQDTNDGSTSTGMKQYNVRDFWYSFMTGRLYGLGNTAGSGPKVVYKDASDVDGGNWTLPATAEGSSGIIRGSFIEWVGGMWMFSTTNKISKWTIGSTFSNSVATVGQTIFSVAPPIISPTDNNMYMFYYADATDKSYVVRVSAAGTPTDDVLPLPVGYKVRSSCLWGNYIAIALTTSNTLARSIIILWDPTLSNFSEIIDIGDGEVRVIENIEGSISAIMDGGMSSSLSIDGGTLIVRMWGGGAVQTLISLKNTAPVIFGRFLQTKVVRDFRAHFGAQLTFNGTTYTGVFSFGRKGPGLPFALSLAQTDSTISTLDGFGAAGGYWFLGTNLDGTILKTNDQSVYTATSFIESQKYSGGDIKQRKLLHSVFATTVPLPAAGQLVLKYRKDEETSYTTLFTETTDNNILTELSGASGVALPEFKEIQFRLESTGGTEITGWGFRFAILDGATTPQS